MLSWTILVWNFKIFQELWYGLREERSQDSQFWTDCCYGIKIYYSHIDYVPMTWGIFLIELWFLMFWKLLSFFTALKIPPLALFLNECHKYLYRWMLSGSWREEMVKCLLFLCFNLKCCILCERMLFKNLCQSVKSVVNLSFKKLKSRKWYQGLLF